MIMNSLQVVKKRNFHHNVPYAYYLHTFLPSAITCDSTVILPVN